MLAYNRMNRFLYRIIILIIFSSVFQSCSIEKRLYLSGYHVEWKKSFYNNEPLQIKAGSSEQNLVEEQQKLVADTFPNIENIFQEMSIYKIPDNNLTASLDNKSISIQYHKTTLHRLDLNKITTCESNVQEKKSEVSNQGLFGRGISSHDMMVKRPHWASKLGFFLGIASLFSWLFYIPLCIFAIGFSILGMIKSSRLKAMKYNGLGLAFIGLILGIFTTLIYILFLFSHVMI